MNDFLQSLRNGQAEKPRTPKTRKNHDNSYHYTSAPRFHSYGGYQNNRSQQAKRPPAQHQPGNQMPNDDISTTSLLTEAIEDLNSHIETLANNQNYLITVQEKTANMLERQAIAIERIVDHLDIGSDGNETDQETAAPVKAATPAKTAAPKKAFKHHYISSRKATPAPIQQPVEEIKPAKAVIRKRKRVITRKPVVESSVTGSKLISREKIMNIIHTMRAEGSTFDQVASHLVELGQPTFSGRGEWHAQTIHRLCSKK